MGAIARVSFDLFTSAFCRRCAQTRAVVQEVVRLVPGSALTEYDIARHPEVAGAAGVERTPTVVIRDAAGAEVFRSTGVPTLAQALRATEHAFIERA